MHKRSPFELVDVEDPAIKAKGAALRDKLIDQLDEAHVDLLNGVVALGKSDDAGEIGRQFSRSVTMLEAELQRLMHEPATQNKRK